MRASEHTRAGRFVKPASHIRSVKGRIVDSDTVHRRPDGPIDVDFYRRRATALRRQAIHDVFKYMPKVNAVLAVLAVLAAVTVAVSAPDTGSSGSSILQKEGKHHG